MTRYSIPSSRADVVERADVRVRELRDRLAPRARSAAATPGQTDRCDGQDLDRDGPLQPRVPRPVDLAHPARAERRQNLVGPQFRTRGEGHNARIIAPIP